MSTCDLRSGPGPKRNEVTQTPPSSSTVKLGAIGLRTPPRNRSGPSGTGEGATSRAQPSPPPGGTDSVSQASPAVPLPGQPPSGVTTAANSAADKSKV